MQDNLVRRESNLRTVSTESSRNLQHLLESYSAFTQRKPESMIPSKYPY